MILSRGDIYNLRRVNRMKQNEFRAKYSFVLNVFKISNM